VAPDSLGSSPIKVDANGDIILPPGTNIYIPNADASECIRIGNGSVNRAGIVGDRLT
jgi:hypothetical protein